MKPCKPGQFLLKHENKCVDECQLPMVKSIVENDIRICENVCAETIKFLYWNGSCFPLCLQPLIQIHNIYGDLCQNPCEGTSKYLYFNPLRTEYINIDVLLRNFNFPIFSLFLSLIKQRTHCFPLKSDWKKSALQKFFLEQLIILWK